MNIEISNYIVGVSISFPSSLSLGFMHFRSLLWGTHLLRIVVSSWWISPFILEKCGLCPQCYRCFNVFKSFLMGGAHLFYPFPSFYFSCICVFIFEVDFLQAAFINSGNFIFLIGVFKPFTLNRIIDMVGFKSASLLLIFYLSHSFFFNTFLTFPMSSEYQAFFYFFFFFYSWLLSSVLFFYGCSWFYNVSSTVIVYLYITPFLNNVRISELCAFISPTTFFVLDVTHHTSKYVEHPIRHGYHFLLSTVSYTVFSFLCIDPCLHFLLYCWSSGFRVSHWRAWALSLAGT